MKKINAFSLIEILIVLGIFAFIFALASPVYGNFFANVQIREVSDSLVEDLLVSRELSISGKNNSSNGIRIFETYYVIYQGNSYSERDIGMDRIVNLPSSMELSSNQTEINFLINHGSIATSTTIIINHASKLSREIRINSYGLVNTNE